MEYECPICEHLNIDVEDSLPDTACSDGEHECQNCGKIIIVGWIAEVEVRGVKNDN